MKSSSSTPSGEFNEPFGKELLTASEVAKACRVKVGTVVNWGRKGWLSVVDHPRGIRYYGTEVREMIEQRNRTHDSF